VTIVLIGLALGALLVFGHDAATRVAGAEAYKILLQFVLVVVLGGGISLAYQAFNRDADLRAQRARHEEERAQVVRESQQRHLRDLSAEYNVVKRARRMLRAQALAFQPEETGTRVRVSKYDEFLQVVLDAQLSLETMSHVVGADNELFPTHSNLIESIDVAETYLRSLITEYENFLPRVGPGEALAELTKLPVLADFIGPYGNSVGFRKHFVHSVQQALSTMQSLAIGAIPPTIG